MPDFVSHEGSKWSAEFAGKRPGTPEFDKAWQDIARRDPKGFQEAQHQYIERTHYTPTVNNVRNSTGVDISQHSKALQNVVWSTGVQHGPGSSIVSDAIKKVESQGIKPDDPDFDRRVINAIYDERGATNAAGQPIHFLHSSPENQRGVLARFASERRDALQELRAERGAEHQSDPPEKAL